MSLLEIILRYSAEVISLVNMHIDTYGDARNNIGLTANLYGSQADGIRVESSGTGQRCGGSLFRILILNLWEELQTLDMKLNLLSLF